MLVVLLRFPSEPLKFNDTRREAIVGFRDRCRAPVIRRYGPTTEDLGGFLAECVSCGHTNSRLAGFSELDSELSLDQLEVELQKRAEQPELGWRPERCEACGSERLNPVMAVYGRYLAEAERDLQLDFVFAGGRIVRIEHFLMESDGATRRIDRPMNEQEAFDLFGAPLSLRQLWREFVAAHYHGDSFVVRDVHGGYVVGMRPFADDHRVAAQQLQSFGAWLDILRKKRPYDAVTFLRDREEDQIPVAFDQSYHLWLPKHSQEITAALIDPFVVADSDTFVATLARQAAFLGLQVSRDSDPNTLFVRFRHDDLDVRLNLGPVFFRVLHEGRTFHRGLRRHFDRELTALASAAALPGALRDALPTHRISVRDGVQLHVVDPTGDVRFDDDLVHLATHFDYRTPEGMAELLRETDLAS